MVENTGVINFSLIKQNKVRDLLKKHGLYSLDDLSNLRSHCFNPDDGKRYHKHIKTYLIDAEIGILWQAYKTIKPEETWNGKMVSFGLMYSRRTNSISFPGDAFGGLEPGQVLFMNLNLLNNLVHLAVGHEVKCVNDEEKTIKICYLWNGASTGSQIIQLKKLSDNQTQVIHETWYRSGSIIRDKMLYPLFHSKAIDEFHTSVRRKAESK